MKPGTKLLSADIIEPSDEVAQNLALNKKTKCNRT